MIPDFTKRHLALFLPTTLFFHTLDCHYWTQIQIVEEFLRPAVRYRTPHPSPHPYIFFRGGGSIAALKLFIWEINLRLSQTRQTWNHKPNAREMLSTMADSVAFFFFFLLLSYIAGTLLGERNWLIYHPWYPTISIVVVLLWVHFVFRIQSFLLPQIHVDSLW